MRSLMVTLLLAGIAHAAPLRLEAPKGWALETLEDADLGIFKIFPSNRGAVGRRWTSGDAVFQVIELTSEVDRAQHAVDQMAGIVDGYLRREREGTRRRIIDRLDRRVFDELVERPGQRLHARWTLALDDHRTLRIVIARCITVDGASPECEAALESARLVVDPPRAWQQHEAEYNARLRKKYGLAVGLPVLAILSIVLVVLRRRRNAKRATS